MEVQSCDSKKLFKVFDASKRKRSRKKREDDHSAVSDGSNSACQANVENVVSRKTSLQDMATSGIVDEHPNGDSTARERGSSASIPREGHRSREEHRLHEDHRSPHRRRHRRAQDRGSSPSVTREGHRSREHRSPEGHRNRDEHRSARRHRRPREELSLALKDGIMSPNRSVSPPSQDMDAAVEAPTQDQDSFIYAFLEDAIKRDKKKHRHGRRNEEERTRSRNTRERERDREESRDQRHRHRRRRDLASRDRDKDRSRRDDLPPSPALDQSVLLETFAKFCSQMNEKTSISPVQRTQSHKSLQCEVASRRDLYVDHRLERVARERSHENTLTAIRSQDNCRPTRSRGVIDSRHETCTCYHEKDTKYEPKIEYDREPKYAPRPDYKEQQRYSSKMDVNRSRVAVNRVNEDDRYHHYPPQNISTRTCIYPYRDQPREIKDYRDYDRRYYDDRRRYLEQKTSRSFDVRRDTYDERDRRTTRSETKKRYDDKCYEKPMDGPDRYPVKDRKPRRTSDRFERNSIVSKEEEYRERESERERDSGLSVADGENSTLSGRTGRSNYLRVVKQEIAEQREAMDKMMKLWKDLMHCFKGISQTQDKDKTLNETACENVRESAAAQLRLWRECMRRYETVARDVGDTDARLMEEINKQRSEMSEMATMWQECLQRYRDMSNDFNTLKQQLATESPTRQPAAPPLVCAEGEGPAPVPAYRVPPAYPHLGMVGGGYPGGGSPLRGRASAPPAWWWGAGAGAEPPTPRHRSSRRSSRRSSPESRDGRPSDRDRRHRHKDARDASRYKEKSSKPSAARSEHRRRKR